MSKLDQHLRDPSYAKVFAEEGFLNEVLEVVVDRMKQTGVNRAELARRLNVSPPNVSQMLSGRRSLTIRTLANLATVLGGRPGFSIVEQATSSGRNEQAESWVPYICKTSGRGWSAPSFAFAGARGDRDDAQGLCG